MRMSKKILLPYLSRSGHNIHSKTVGGGIEKFVRNLYEAFPADSIPVEITTEDRQAKKTKKVFLDAVRKNKPDLIIINDIDWYFTIPLIEEGIPTIMVMHEPLVRDIRYVTWWRGIQEFIDAGGHLYFVSKHQAEFHDKNVKRITGWPLRGVKGTINSSFANGDELVSKQLRYDAVTIGRTDLTKNPFLLHKKLSKTDLSSCVLTNAENYQHSENQKKYWDDNLHWVNPQYTYRGLTHRDTLETMSMASCYVSTCPVESWGITVLEALLHGVPVILLCDKSGRHSSESIPENHGHFKILNKNVTPEELTEAIHTMRFKFDAYENRMALSESTKKKHSKEKWVDKWSEMMYNVPFEVLERPTLTEFAANGRPLI
jgi:hypothetical protein